MKFFCNIFILFLWANLYALASNCSDNTTQIDEKKIKPPRPPFPIGHIPNFSNNNSLNLSVFFPTKSENFKENKIQLSQEKKETRKKANNNSSCAPIPICYQSLPVITIGQTLKSCLKQTQISQEQQDLRKKVFEKIRKTTKVSFLLNEKSKSSSDCIHKYNYLKCAFLCDNHLKNENIN